MGGFGYYGITGIIFRARCPEGLATMAISSLNSVGQNPLGVVLSLLEFEVMLADTNAVGRNDE